MPHSLRFFYFGYQCPHNAYLLARIKTLAWRESVPLHLVDISDDASACEQYQIFSPTTLVVNEVTRWLGPFSKEEVLALLYDEELPPTAPPREQSDMVVDGDLAPVDSESVLSTCAPCLQSDDIGLCRGKAEWTESVLRESGLTHLGYLHFVDGLCVGGAEYLPSMMVPYPIPDKRDTNAFLTCSFRTDPERDYRSSPLRRLVDDLKRFGFDTLSVVSSTETTFPNGPSRWFEKMGFEDIGILAHEELPPTDLRYMQLTI
jgi:hypothetical protein